MSMQSNTLVFDCDGVVLDSNEIKTNCFWSVAKSYADEESADKLVHYHKNFGGISRYKKFEYFFTEIYPVQRDQKNLITSAIQDFGDQVFNELMKCPLISGVKEYLAKEKGQKYIVSGGDQAELRQIFKQRDLAKYFVEIYGSPENKIELIKNYIKPTPEKRFTFFGDSQVDFEAAEHFGMDFVFVSGRTEFKNWEIFFKNRNVEVVRDFDQKLIDLK